MIKVTNGEKTRTVLNAGAIPSGYRPVDSVVEPIVEAVVEPEMLDDEEEPTEEE